MPKDMHGVMHEFKHGELHSGSSKGPVVQSRKQAIAIGLSEQRQQGKKVAPKPAKSAKRQPGGLSGGTPPGALSHRPPVFKNASTFAGRRAASRTRYGS